MTKTKMSGRKTHHVGIQPRFTRIEAHRYRSPERKAKKVSMKMDNFTTG